MYQLINRYRAWLIIKDMLHGLSPIGRMELRFLQWAFGWYNWWFKGGRKSMKALKKIANRLERIDDESGSLPWRLSGVDEIDT